jgi:hypothetical protein
MRDASGALGCFAQAAVSKGGGQALGRLGDPLAEQEFGGWRGVGEGAWAFLQAVSSGLFRLAFRRSWPLSGLAPSFVVFALGPFGLLQEGARGGLDNRIRIVIIPYQECGPGRFIAGRTLLEHYPPATKPFGSR